MLTGTQQSRSYAIQAQGSGNSTIGNWPTALAALHLNDSRSVQIWSFFSFLKTKCELIRRFGVILGPETHLFL